MVWAVLKTDHSRHYSNKTTTVRGGGAGRQVVRTEEELEHSGEHRVEDSGETRVGGAQ